jgi:uncharacterized protein YacL
MRILFYLILMVVGGLVAWGTKVPSIWMIGGGLGGLIAAWVLIRASATVEQALERGAAKKMAVGGLTATIGAFIGLVSYFILELIFPRDLWLQITEGLILLFLIILGFRVGYHKENLFAEIFSSKVTLKSNPKLLDTSVIIDGRIGDLIKTGFIEGEIIIPQFILDELHNIADSPDNLRRRKGRRGLDILGDLRQNSLVKIKTLERDYSGGDVDRKLIRLAKELDGKIITTDYNLNKVAKVEDVPVLNINELANAVKPRFIPGEELEVEVIDRGEEIGQGVGYLDDGTMVVVENGRRFIGKKIKAIVNSSLQTEAGKMLFVRPKGESKGRPLS